MISSQNTNIFSLTKNLFKVGVSLVLVFYSILLLISTIKFSGRITAIILSTCFFTFLLHDVFHISSHQELDWLGTKNNPCDVVRYSRAMDDRNFGSWYKVCENKVIEILYEHKIIIKGTGQKVHLKEFDDLAIEAKRRLDESVVSSQRFWARRDEIANIQNKTEPCEKEWEGEKRALSLNNGWHMSSACRAYLYSSQYKADLQRMYDLNREECMEIRDSNLKEYRAGITGSGYYGFCAKYFEDHPDEDISYGYK